MRKNKFAIFFLLLVGMCFTTNVYAASYPSTTGKIENPKDMKLAVTTDTPVYELQTSKATIQGRYSYVYFWDRTDLPTSFVSSNKRTLEVLLMEADAGDNSDDIVKMYTYHFVGRKMDGVDVKTEDSGNIDSSGDKVGEFYLQMTLIPVDGDTAWNTDTGVFFKYEISVK